MNALNQDQKLTPLQSAALKRKLVEAEIISRAWSDETFRRQLESDPRTALKDAGFPVPEGTAVQVSAEDVGTLTIVLPSQPQASTELDESELGAVAGGKPGAIETGRCDAMEKSKDIYHKGGNSGIFGLIGIVSTAAAGVTGYSWAWQ